MDISIFNEPINNYNALYPIDELNLWGINLLVKNCFQMGMDITTGQSINNANVSVATVDPGIWLPEFLDKMIFKFSYIAQGPIINTFQMDVFNKIYSKSIDLDRKEFSDIEEMVKYFDNYDKFSTLVLYSAAKYVDLTKLTSQYIIRYKDITDIRTKRDLKIGSIIG